MGKINRSLRHAQGASELLVALVETGGNRAYATPR